MTENKRFTTVELPKPNRWGIWYDGACLSTYQVCILLNEYVDVKKENEQLKKELDKLKVVNEMLSIDFSNSEHELWRENEQLKQSNKDAWDLIRFIYNEIKEDGSMDLSRIKDLVEFDGDVE